MTDTDRYWNGERWVYPEEIADALNAALLAVDEYYNGDRGGLSAGYWRLMLPGRISSLDRRDRSATCVEFRQACA